jgi:Uma2 family endonuclease
MTIHVPYPGRFTTREFDALAAKLGRDGERIELLRGMIVKMNAKYIPHGAMQTDLSVALRAGLKSILPAWRVDQEISVDFFEGFQPMPDIVVWNPAEAPQAARTIPGAAVKLIVEIAATSVAADLGPMAQDYAAAGLAEYWVVDVDQRVLHRHGDPGPDGYRTVDAFALADGAASLTIPGLAISPGAV